MFYSLQIVVLYNAREEILMYNMHIMRRIYNTAVKRRTFTTTITMCITIIITLTSHNKLTTITANTIYSLLYCHYNKTISYCMNEI